MAFHTCGEQIREEEEATGGPTCHGLVKKLVTSNTSGCSDKGITLVNAHLSWLEAVVVASPESPESPDISLASEPQTHAQPNVVANVSQKRCLQSTLDAFYTVPLGVQRGGDDCTVSERSE